VFLVPDADARVGGEVLVAQPDKKAIEQSATRHGRNVLLMAMLLPARARPD
jgi:hypothetical protein